MFDQNGHLTDEELIRLIDGECSFSNADEARAHYSECLNCRSRRSQLEQTLAELGDIYSSTISAQMLDSGSGRRAELKDRLTAAGLESPASWLGQYTRFTQHQGYALLVVSILTITVIAFSRISTYYRGQLSASQSEIRLLPDSALTPGATHPVSLAEVCSPHAEALDPAVSASVRETVFREYGMNIARDDEYQVDYLINPQLGGTADVRNLWPEPYGSTVWNARVKDELENRLHRLVCDKQIDLTSAQHEIATDWIAAYKKYFHTENPAS
jgi:hypothetical protein